MFEKSFFFIKNNRLLFLYFLLMSFLYSLLSLYRHWHFISYAWDLGIFDQAIWHYSRFEAPACTIRGFTNILGDHFTPILSLLAPFYWLLPRVEVLLVAQAVLFMLPLFPIFFFAQKRLGRGPAFAFCGAYSIFWGIQAAANFDFHEISFAVPLIAFAVYFIDEERWKSFSVCALLLMLTKEDMCIYVVFLGFFILLRRRFKWGLFWVAFGLCAFFLEIKLIIPFFKGAPGYDYWTYSQLGPGPVEAVKNLMIHPWLLPEVIFSNRIKDTTILCTYFSYLFLPLLSPLAILTLPSIFERMLNDQSWMWPIQAHQYSAVISPILALSAADGLYRFLKNFHVEATRKKWLAVLCGLILAVNAAALPVAPLGKLFQPSYYHLTPNDLTGRQVVKLIPEGASVVAQNTIVPHLSHRNLIWRMDQDSFSSEKNEDYVVACRNLDFGPPNNFEAIEQYLNSREQKGYVKVFDQEGWIVLKKAEIKFGN
ncbi:MAG TPA: DUF2079 domain-containing protein [bacterium]|nr:DUF2079 domain-containing protein [bacterium]